MRRVKGRPEQDAPAFQQEGVPLPKEDKKVKTAVLQMTGKPPRIYFLTVLR